jgi:hypothetical protein
MVDPLDELTCQLFSPNRPTRPLYQIGSNDEREYIDISCFGFVAILESHLDLVNDFVGGISN